MSKVGATMNEGGFGVFGKRTSEILRSTLPSDFGALAGVQILHGRKTVVSWQSEPVTEPVTEPGARNRPARTPMVVHGV